MVLLPRFHELLAKDAYWVRNVEVRLGLTLTLHALQMHRTGGRYWNRADQAIRISGGRGEQERVSEEVGAWAACPPESRVR